MSHRIRKCIKLNNKTALTGLWLSLRKTYTKVKWSKTGKNCFEIYKVYDYSSLSGLKLEKCFEIYKVND